ncbi:uncharacterized protein LOC123560483 [Mercenaria mercenaria]|uniref:uncharacterized protein LOC123560483 n=1 Tax=Mercenaria mercenaria TaxID=6596 RepID=UPI00234F4769|nr:uncharacterized protein LOC123560483 [Mercenaria mercenaria]
MVGKHNSVLSRIREKQPGVYDLGCLCHVANTCLSYGLKQLPSAVEELLIDVYYHFLHSSKRKEEYKEFQQFTVTDAAKILKHCPTRWLSLDRCVRRTLQQWPALHSYFNSHEEAEKCGSCVYRCANNLNNEQLLLVFHCLEYILAPLLEFNTTFQADAVMIGYLHQEMSRLLRKFLGKFVTTSAINSSSQITMVDFKNPNIQHPDDNLAIGMNARRFLNDNPDLPQETVNGFFRTVREFYIEVTEKMIKKFPFTDKTLKAIGFVNPDLRDKVESESVVQLSTLFCTDQSIDVLQDEYMDYQLSPSTELPTFKYGETALEDFWFSLAEYKLPTGSRRFKLLPELAFVVLTLPHSNAETERCFSTCRKIQTDSRGNLSNNSVNALLSIKLNTRVECFNVRPSEKLLTMAKKACVSYNEEKKCGV